MKYKKKMSTAFNMKRTENSYTTLNIFIVSIQSSVMYHIKEFNVQIAKET